MISKEAARPGDWFFQVHNGQPRILSLEVIRNGQLIFWTGKQLDGEKERIALSPDEFQQLQTPNELAGITKKS